MISIVDKAWWLIDLCCRALLPFLLSLRSRSILLLDFIICQAIIATMKSFIRAFFNDMVIIIMAMLLLLIWYKSSGVRWHRLRGLLYLLLWTFLLSLNTLLKWICTHSSLMLFIQIGAYTCATAIIPWIF